MHRIFCIRLLHIDMNTLFCLNMHALYKVPSGIIRGRKVSRITFFAMICKKTFAIQAISYIKIPSETKSTGKHSQKLPDSQNS